MVRSPCIKQCKLDDGKCTGCGRTLSEISNWNRMTDAQKADVVLKHSSITWDDLTFPPINLWVLHSARWNNY
jgi:hypothetical protein